MIRKVRQSDAEKIEKILKKIPQFTENEIEVAMELVNIAANNQTQKDYNVFVFEKNEKILGYHCTGKRPLTDAVYDLYWIVADPETEIKGVGTELVKHAENFVNEKNARWLLAETSSRESYSRTRNFYMRNSFSIVAEINDFYSAGDNLIVFGKYFK
jgi:ribosomal protein S18 acetylase RimI-like enzyme